MKRKKILHLGAAAAITVTGIGAASTMSKTVSATTFNSAIKRVKINYLPGQGLPIYTNYNGGRFMGFRAKAGTIWNVTGTAVDRQGNLWYMVGDNEWIQARYTLDVQKKVKRPVVKKVKRSPLSKIRTKAKKTINRIKKPSAKTIKKNKLIAKKARVKKARQIVNKTLHPSSQAPKVSSIIALAKQQLGKPYVWGAEGPNKFDCSGLVQYVYGKLGVNLPRTTYDQVKVGVTVSMNKLKPGDLLFWGSPTAPYHVAIYIGKNQYVNSATPEQGTILQTISSYYYPTIAKRVL